ncbi:MAG: cbb3-type cytochrome c oxidase subunit I [Nitrospinae bacterium]|nr:cbb3-type cytochrome c oxidase subunit I [Nitrospinota bacterium]
MGGYVESAVWLAYGPMALVFFLSLVAAFYYKPKWVGDPSEFRVCSITGMKVHIPAGSLIKANLWMAFLFLALGGVMAFGVAFTRWPVVHLLPDTLFYRALTMHGLAMLVFWIVWFEVALMYFTITSIIGARLAAIRTAWIAFGLMLGGSLVVVLTVLTGNADIMFTSYPPLMAHQWYYWGILVFAVGAFFACAVYYVTMAVAFREKVITGSLPLGVYGMSAGVTITLLTLFHGAVFYFPTWLWSMGLFQNIDVVIYRLIFWAFGHSSQQINVCMMIACWYMVGTLSIGSKPLNEKLCRTAYVLYILFICIASEHHLLVDPAISPAHKAFNTGYFMHMAVLASMIHALAVPASYEIALRKKGYTQGLFEWLKKAPWSNPAFSASCLSIVGFGWVGGITGVTFGTEQLNIISHNTWRMTGHFHGTVVAGTSLAFMSMTYYMIPIALKKEIAFPSLAKIQPWLFGPGVILFAVTMMFIGGFGIPRRHWDITFSEAAFSFSFNPIVSVGFIICAIGWTMAIIGGLSFVVIAIGSLLNDKEVE